MPNEITTPPPLTGRILGEGIPGGLHAGAQLYVSRHGQTITEIAIGQARIGVPMTPATVNHWLSCGKPIAAVAIAQQWERGRLTLDDPVARHVPEFATNGKGRVTI